MKNKFYILLLLLFAFGNSQAQLIFNMPNPTACNTGESVDLDVTVENYDNLVAMQFTIAWSANLLNYVSIDNFHPNLGNIPLVITGNAATGSVNYTWTAEPGDFTNGVDIPNGAILFTLHFTSTANLGTTNITIDNSAIPVVVEDNQGNIDNMITVNGGMVTVGDTENPTITCPQNYTANSSNGNPIQVNDDLSAIAMDNCNVATVTYSSTDATVLMSPPTGINNVTGQSFAVGTTTVTYQVTDDTGLTNTCQFEVLITNNMAAINLDIEDYSIGCSNSGDNISLQVFVDNFNGVTGISMQISYDNNLLTLLPSSDFHPNMDGFNNGDFNSPTPGTLNVFWQTSASNNATGVDVPDGESLFTLNFTPDAALMNTSVNFNFSLISLVGNVPANVNPMSGIITTVNSGGVADFNGTTTICSGESTDLSINLSGGTAPYTVIYNDGNTDITINNYENSDPISVSPSTTTTYTLISVTDNAGCPANINNNSALVTVNQGPTAASILGGMDTCPGDEVDLTVSITGGTAPFTIVYNENIPGSSNLVTLTNYQNNDPISVAPTISTIYILESITDANECVLNLTNTSTVVAANDENAPTITFCPSPITQDADASGCGAIVTFPTPTATDDCDDSPSILLQTSINSGEEFPVGESTVTYFIQDNVNNSATCEFTITINDNQPPQTMNCVPFIPPVAADAGECSAIVNFTEPTATDNCMIANSTASHNSGDAFSVGITNVVFSFTDNSGLTTNCNTTITVNDDENPTIICPSDITAAASTMECTAIVNWTPPTAMDNCPGATATNTTTFNPNDALPFGVTTITYSATDAAGNSADAPCSFQITVFDETDPIFTTCPTSQTVAPDMGGTTAIVDNLEPEVFDNCGIDTVYYELMGVTSGDGPNDASGTEFNLGETTVTYTTVDVNGLSATCVFTITVMSDEQLSLTCPDNQMENSALDSCGVTVFGLAPIATPISELATIVYELTGATTGTGSDDASNIFYNVGITTVTYTATDNDGNDLTCAFTVTVNDIIDPTFTLCPSNMTDISNDAGICGAVVNYPTPTASDDCSAITNISCSTDSGETFPVGTTTVTCTATDALGNTVDCVFDVTVIDTENPTITCPMSQTVSVDATGNSAVVENIPPTTADNCGIDTTFYVLTGVTTDDDENDASGTTFNLGETTVTYTTMDSSDSTATCSFTITVIDDTELVLTCPDNQIELSDTDACGTIVNDISATATPSSELANLTYQLTGATTGTGNDASGVFYNVGTTTVNYTATDNDGNMLNCSFTVTVNDAIMPVIANCPTNQTINVEANACSNTATWMLPTATDNCPNLNLTSTHNSGAEFSVGNTVVTYLAADANGNQATCSFTITVTDNILPTLTNCPPNQQIPANQDECSATVIWNAPMVSDNCPNAMLTANQNSGDSFGLGTTQVTYTGSDASGNQATCSFTVTIFDAQNPVIANCPNNITVPVTGADCNSSVTWTVPTATDNCPNVVLNGNPTSGSIFSTGTTTVNYIATDAAGNTTQCSFNVTVQDNENPNVTFCPSSMTQNAIQNECSANITWQNPTFSDNCAITSVVSNYNSGDSFTVSGPITVTYTASDASGNTATCQFVVEVIDNQPPIIFPMMDDIIVGNAPGLCNAVVNYVAPQGFDNCGVTGFVTTHPSGSEFPIGTTTVNYIASDAAGNVTMQSFTITVMDNEPPKPVCPENIEITVDGTNLSDPSGSVTNVNPIDCDNIFLEITEPTVTDNCEMSSFVQTAGIDFTNGTPFPVGTTLMEYTATDASGNQSTCAFNVNVNPIEFPNINLSSIFPCEGDDFLAQIAPYPNASFNWFNQNGDLVNSGSAFPISNISLADAGLYTIQMILPTCTLSQQFQLTVFEKPEIEASANDILCTDGNQDLNLMATTQNGVSVNNYQWVFNGGAPFSMEQNPVIPNATIANAGEYVVRAISDNGCFDTDTVTVNISAVVQIPMLNATPQTTCVGGTVNLTGQSYFGNDVQYIWSANPMAGSGLVVVNNFTTTATPTVAGTYTYFFSAIVDGCQTEVAQETVVIGEPPVSSIDIIGDVDCVDGTTPVTLQSTFTDPSATYLWTLNNDFLSNEENVLINNVSPDNNGSYKLVVTLPNGCQSEAALDLNVTEGLDEPDPIMGSDVGCFGEPITFIGTNYGNGNITYLWLLNGSPIPNSNSPTVTFVPTLLGSNLISFSATKDNCNSGTVIKNFTVEAAPTADLQIDGETTCLAGNTPITILSNSPDAQNFFWLDENNVLQSNDADFVIENANATDSGNYYFVADSPNGCRNIDTINVQITDGLPQIEANLDGQPCEDANLKLTSTSIPNATYAWIDSKGDNFSSAQNPLLVLASPEFNGTYTVTATANGCSTTDSVEVEILEAPTAIDDDFPVITDTATEFNVLLNDGVDLNQNIIITVLQPTTQGTLTNLNDGTFSYTPKKGSLEADAFVYQVCYEACPNTCDIAFVNLNVQFPTDNCTATTVITPNGDGVNDRFVVFCLDTQEFPENELTIFGSWGDQVFKMKGYDNSWKGTYENEPLPDGTYYYIFKRDPNAEAEKGFVMIYR